MATNWPEAVKASNDVVDADGTTELFLRNQGFQGNVPIDAIAHVMILIWFNYKIVPIHSKLNRLSASYRYSRFTTHLRYF